MKYAPTFIATIKDGKIVMEKPEEWQKWLKSLENAGKLEITVTKYRQKRSEQANRLYFAWLTLLEEETGQDKDDFHDFFKKKLLTRIVDLSGKIEKVVGSTAKMDSLEFYDYMERVQQISMEFFNIILPNPYEEEWRIYRTKKGRKSILV